MRVFKLTLVLVCAAAILATHRGEVHDGLMDAVEVTAVRFSENIGAYVGSVPGVEVTARRYEFEDDAWSGLMDGVEVTGKRIGTGTLARVSGTEAGTKRAADPFHIMVH